MQNVLNAVNILLQVATKAQNSGILTLKEASVTFSAVEIAANFVENTEKEIGAMSTKGTPKPVPIDEIPTVTEEKKIRKMSDKK